MIICKSPKVILVEIPGAKCEAIFNLFAPYVQKEWQGESVSTNQRYFRFSESLLNRLEIDPKDYYKVVGVRNPYTRLIDIYQNYYKSPEAGVQKNFGNNLRFYLARHTGLNPFPSQEFHHMFPEGDFKSFVEFMDYILTKFRLDISRKYIGAADQYSYIENDSWLKFEFIASFETLKLDVADLSQEFNLEIVDTFSSIEEQNELEQGNLLEYYDEETLKVVNRLFVRDFVYFGYKQLSVFDLNCKKELEALILQTK
ncbi:sulfotransferase family 2 domain-containing protein [Waterburya agarophytonicola K14]|uniref:Sulfotransferase family 2 domain-containing protein n=1 Tax=Waterburya agarophytonicola KI4 TaxID=2874699 RepID=A0A964FF85_9CYAN|nr:sulfotransferase family 2 domain-containing protein [Waterburya agarophytonicola]MCC0175544.1 sulfotransferase family 2 domain-containing protein [Waterburya agarophytonicola KI4]